MKNIDQSPRDIFFEAIQQESPEKLREFLDLACAGDAQLLAKVEGLLGAHQQAGGFMGNYDTFAESASEGTAHELIGQQVGPYKLLEVIGQGGMGTVYMAEQIEPVRRRVAVKVIKTGMDTRQVIARFEAERQALAMMDHPNIAKVLDAGTTQSGRPFFVMELVKGQPITKFCDEQQLDTRGRLELFQQVCHAVQHAHQKGIIHRDLKPSNVLVAMYDDKPVPKVIDFGVAKATGEELTERTMFTRFGQIVGTLEYMSPEQAQFNQLDIDTRSDVYSLGAILCEMLSGEPPFDRKVLRQKPLDETLRMIREDEPTRPSTKLSDPARSASIASNRNTSPDRLGAVLRGDLDWIVMKALAKDRMRRYETADALALDVQRYVDNEPVTAGPPTRLYRLSKFARRHRATLFAASAFAMVLVLGIITTTWQAIRASNALAEKTTALTEKNAALQEAQTSAAQQSIMTDLVLRGIVDSSRPGTGNPNGTVREALFEVEKTLDTEGVSDSQLEGWLRHNIGEYFFDIGEYVAAKRNYSRAFELRSRIFGPRGEATLSTVRQLSVLFSRLGEHDRAIEFAKQFANAQADEFGETSPEAFDAQGSLAHALCQAGRFGNAEEIFTSILKKVRSLGLKEKEAWILSELGILYYGTGRHDEAKQCWSSALDFYQTLGKDYYPTTLSLEMNLTNLLRQQGKFVEAKEAYRDLLPKVEAIRGEDHPETIRIVNNLAECYYALRDLQNSAKLYRRVLGANCKRFGKDDERSLKSMFYLAASLRKIDSDESTKLSKEAAELASNKWGPQDKRTLFYLNGLGVAAQDVGDSETASDTFQEIIAVRKKLKTADPSDNENSFLLGCAYCNLGCVHMTRDNGEAVEEFTNAVQTLDPLLTSEPGMKQRLAVRRFLSESYGGRATAQRYLGHHELSLKDLESALHVADSDRRKDQLELIKAKVVAAQGNGEEATSIAEKIFDQHKDDGEFASMLAGVYAISANATEKESQQSESTVEYVNSCFETLEIAKRLGQFDSTSAVLHFEIDPDFDSVRDDARYSRFVESLHQSDKNELTTGSQRSTDGSREGR
jgi:serine/threonine protein kinase/Flp pilus assembly protein TadD